MTTKNNTTAQSNASGSTHRVARSTRATTMLERVDRTSHCHTFEAYVGPDRRNTQHSTIERDCCDRPTIFDWRVKRPHWMAHGDGYSTTAIAVEENGSLNIKVSEQAEGKRAGKEAWGKMTPVAARALAELILGILDKKINY